MAHTLIIAPDDLRMLLEQPSIHAAMAIRCAMDGHGQTQQDRCRWCGAVLPPRKGLRGIPRVVRAIAGRKK